MYREEEEAAEQRWRQENDAEQEQRMEYDYYEYLTDKMDDLRETIELIIEKLINYERVEIKKQIRRDT